MPGPDPLIRVKDRTGLPGRRFFRDSAFTMTVILIPLLQIINIVINLFIWALIGSAVLSWLTAFGIINTRNRFVDTVGSFLWKITEPPLRPLRRIIPDLGGIDLAPMAMILILWFVQGVLSQLMFRVAMGGL